MKAVIAWGRYNPPTKGHGLLFKVVSETGRKEGGTCYAFVSHSVNSATELRKASRDPGHRAAILRNPLSWQAKIWFLAKIYKDRFDNLVIVDDETVRTPDNVFDWLRAKGYDEIVWCAGEDRVAEFEGVAIRYQRTHQPFKSIEVVSAGARDPDSELDASDTTSISGTKLRQAAVDDDYQLFSSAIDSDDESLIRGLFDAVKQGLAIPGMENTLMEGATDLSRLDPLTESEMSAALNLINQFAPEEADQGSLLNQIAMLLRKKSDLGASVVAQKIAYALGAHPDQVKKAVFAALTPKSI
jgi:nicotinic acid mononucleotide adenylyltransferase